MIAAGTRVQALSGWAVHRVHSGTVADIRRTDTDYYGVAFDGQSPVPNDLWWYRSYELEEI